MSWQKYGTFITTLLILALIFFYQPANAVATPQLLKISVTPHAGKTRVLLSFNQSIDYKVFTLDNPNRFIIDLPGTQLMTALDQQIFANTVITHLRKGHPTAGVLRLVFEVKTAQQPQLTHFSSKGNQSGEQIAVDFSAQVNNTNDNNTNLNNTPTTNADNKLQQTQGWIQESLADNNDNASNAQTITPATTAPTTVTTTPSPIANPTINSNNDQQPPFSKPPGIVAAVAPAPIASVPVPVPTPTPKVNAAPPRPIVVVIDPGHGGKDPGTTGPLGVHEKDVVLAISRDLAQTLQKDPCFRAALTRSGDYFIPLRGRLAIARQDKGDIFVAIHADAYPDRYASGAAVFALSAHGASSEAARWLAEKENYSELNDVSLSGLPDQSEVLRSVLIDLSQTATISSSLQLGTSLLQQLNKVGNLHYHRVEQAPFMVLKSPDIPSLLVETGFLSNPNEERRLRDPAYQQKMAQALYLGIRSYFLHNPPPNTLIASIKQSKKNDA